MTRSLRAWSLAGPVILWLLLLIACGDSSPAGPTESGDVSQDEAIGAEVAAAAELGPGAHVGFVSGTVTIAGASARAAQPAPILLMTFDDFSEDGRLVLDGTVTYRMVTQGRAWIEGDLRVRLHMAVSSGTPVRQLAEGLRLRVEFERPDAPAPAEGAGDVAAASWLSECIQLRGFTEDTDAATTARARVARQLLAAAERGGGTHAGASSGTLTTEVLTEWIAGDTGRSQRITLRMTFDGYADEGLAYDGSLAARIERAADGTHERYAGEVEVSGRLTGRVTLCEELGRTLVAAALSADAEATTSDTRGTGG